MIGRERITFRTETPDDIEFLYSLYASTRAEEMKLVDWPDEQKAAFLRQQFDAQRAHYHAHYTAAEYSIILEDALPIGRLYVQKMAEDVRIMDIALLPEHRGRGIGGLLIRELLDDAATSGRSVSIHVEVFNPAIQLYERLGFRQIDTYGPYHLMEWRSGAMPAEDGGQLNTAS